MDTAAASNRGEMVDLADRIRAPLAVVYGYLSLLSDERLSARQRTQAFAMAIQKCVEMNIVLREQLAASLRDSAENAETEPVLTRAG